MRFIKVFLVGFIGLFLVITLLSLLLPSDIKVSRAIVINTTTGKVYTQIADLTNWKNWQPLFASDSAVVTFSPTKKDAAVTYKNKQVFITIASADPAGIKFLLRSKDEYDVENEIAITPVVAQNEVQVEWRATTKLHWYPWDKFYGIFIDRITGGGYEESLNNLKKFLEAQP